MYPGSPSFFTGNELYKISDIKILYVTLNGIRIFLGIKLTKSIL